MSRQYSAFVKRARFARPAKKFAVRLGYNSFDSQTLLSGQGISKQVSEHLISVLSEPRCRTVNIARALGKAWHRIRYAHLTQLRIQHAFYAAACNMSVCCYVGDRIDRTRGQSCPFKLRKGSGAGASGNPFCHLKVDEITMLCATL